MNSPYGSAALTSRSTSFRSRALAGSSARITQNAEIALIRIPAGAYSIAADRVREITAAFDAE